MPANARPSPPFPVLAAPTLRVVRSCSFVAFSGSGA